MPGQIRPNSKATKIAYAILKTPKDKRQRNEPKPSQEMMKRWFRDSSAAQ